MEYDGSDEESERQPEEPQVSYRRVKAQIVLPAHVAQWLNDQRDELFPTLSSVGRRIIVQAWRRSCDQAQVGYEAAQMEVQLPEE